MNTKKFMKSSLIIFLVIFVIFFVIVYKDITNWCLAIGGSCNPKFPPLNWHIKNIAIITGVSVILALIISGLANLFSLMKKK
jgi:hypothetical protein